MANNFSTIKSKSASEKFNLIRIEPARAVHGSLALSSGTTYTVTFAFKELSKVEVNGTLYTKVSGVPNATEYSFNETTRLLTINLGATLTTQIVVVYYFILYTRFKDRITYEDPEDNTTTPRRWKARISQSPTFNFNLSDITKGFLSFGASSINISNEDNDFQQYLTANDSFSKKKITIWLCLDNTENVKLVYRGFVNRITVSKKVTIEYFDEFSKLSDIFYSNSTLLNSTYNTTRFANLLPSHENRPIRKLYSEVSYYKVVNQTVGSTSLFKLDHERLLEASCINFSNTISTTTNREWGTVLYVGDGGHQTDTVQSTDHAATDYSVIEYSSGKKFRIGDTLKINTHYVQVYEVDTDANTFKCTKNASLATSDTITRAGISSVIIKQGEDVFYAYYDRDYSITYTPNTNDIIKITFVNNFEATLSCATLDPNAHQVRFRAWSDTSGDYNHGSVVSDILTEAGFDVNASSITTANSDLTATTNFYNPPIGSTSFSSYQTILEKILSSTFGYLSLNNDLEIKYGVFKTLSATNTISDREILLNTFKAVVDYNDVISSIIPENDHDIIETDYTNASLEDNTALYLHGTKSIKTYNHVLDGTGRMQKILDVLSERSVQYSMTVKTEPDVIIGDLFTLSRDNLLGDETSDVIIVLGIDKKAEEVNLKTTDLLGI